MHDLINIIKRAAQAAVENGKPCDLRYGTVVSTEPLSVRVTPSFILPAGALIVPEHLTDYEVETSLLSAYGWGTQESAGGAGDAAYEAHDHGIVHERRKIKIHAALKTGDKIALLRQSGGQFYFVLDRLPKEASD